ncbi:LPS export ABC transporter permease LptF [Teredinibacter franksiae]|jgi:Predicted permeases|uniref:LPS export ABC transporter permease LptF n=1 Tax=Teredinibacter franksiae TaxID=2761453 RepID=UPI001628A318|nr:LPS export ABC transporter permease LptF [Teredinibacter franksiae]
MIIFRYLAREVLTSMFAVSLVLLMIIISARFVNYLAEAAAGELDAGILLTLMAYRLPAYLELILPLGLFIGILFAYGRLYLDSEMTVLHACGMSQARLVVYTTVSSLVVAIVVGVFSLYLGPEGVRASESLLAEQRSRTDFETLKPARFHALDSGTGTSYAESISADKKQLRNVFMAKVSPIDPSMALDQAQQSELDLSVVTADSGETVIDPDSGRKYLLLKNGRRYIGIPGHVDYRVVSFSHYSQMLPEPDYAVKAKRFTDGLTTSKLLEQSTNEARAALQWRFSMPVLVMVVGFLAVPLSRTQPRQGRYAKMLPAVVLYMLYLVCVNAARGVIEEGNEPVPGILWLVHGAFFGFGLILLADKRFIFRRSKKASEKGATA